jgi:hypothetical protein
MLSTICNGPKDRSWVQTRPFFSGFQVSLLLRQVRNAGVRRSLSTSLRSWTGRRKKTDGTRTAANGVERVARKVAKDHLTCWLLTLSWQFENSGQRIFPLSRLWAKATEMAEGPRLCVRDFPSTDRISHSASVFICRPSDSSIPFGPRRPMTCQHSFHPRFRFAPCHCAGIPL